MSTPQSDKGHKGRKGRRHLLLGVVLALLGLVLLSAVIRGTWADSTAKNPATSAEGIIVQLYQTPQGDKQVRSAVVLDYPLDEVWALLTDYQHYDENFATLAETRSERDPDGRHHLTGKARAGLFGDWPYDIHVKEETPDPETRVLSWDDSNETMKRNRGSWTLKRLAPERTLAIYSLEVEAPPYPNFLIRNIFLSRHKDVVAALQQAVERKHTQPR